MTAYVYSKEYSWYSAKNEADLYELTWTDLQNFAEGEKKQDTEQQVYHDALKGKRKKC